jgi:predicted dehydrogenase
MARHCAQHLMHGWSVAVEFQSGALGHLELISPRQGDFEEGFRIHGANGSVTGHAPLPWFQRAHVETFLNGEYRRVLGEDGFTFKRQIEGFADTVLNGTPQHGATLEDGIAAVRALVAISHSVYAGHSVALADVSGAVLSTDEPATLQAVA